MAVIILIAALLRLIAISHGGNYIYNTDEPTFVRSTLGLRFTFNIERFDWPHFGFYFHYIFYLLYIKFRGVAQIFGLRPILEPTLPLLWQDPFIFYVISRCINAVIGALTIIPLYMLTKKKYGYKIAIYASIIFTLIPQHIFLSHFATLDVFLTFWMTFAAYFILLVYEKRNKKYILAAGVLSGLSTGSKYNGIFILGLYPLTYVFNFLKSKSLIYLNKHLAIFGVLFAISIITFLIVTPNIITNWDTFWSRDYGKGIIWQIKDNSKPVHLVDYPDHLLKLLVDLVFDVNIIVFVLFLISAFITTKVYITSKRSDKTNILMAILSFCVIYFLYFSINRRAGSRFWIPLYPFITIFSAYAIAKFESYIQFKKIILIGFFVVLLIPAVMASLSFFKLNTQTEFITKYVENRDKLTKIYFDSESIDHTNFINNLGMKYVYKDEIIKSGSILVSEIEYKNNNLTLLEIIDNKNRPGPKLFIYKYINDQHR